MSGPEKTTIGIISWFVSTQTACRCWWRLVHIWSSLCPTVLTQRVQFAPYMHHQSGVLWYLDHTSLTNEKICTWNSVRPKKCNKSQMCRPLELMFTLWTSNYCLASKEEHRCHTCDFIVFRKWYQHLQEASHLQTGWVTEVQIDFRIKAAINVSLNIMKTEWMCEQHAAFHCV